VLVGGLPDAPALEVCRVLREGEPGRSWDRDVPLIVLGDARDDAVDRVHAFERGCDDVVPRPFHYEELVARIHAVLRRTQPGLRERLAAGPLAIDRATRRVTVHGLPVALAAKEYELLVKLATQPMRVFTKDELLRDVWGFRSLGSKRRLYQSHSRRCRLTSAAVDNSTESRVPQKAGEAVRSSGPMEARATKGSHAGESYTSKLARKRKAVVAECEGLRRKARCERALGGNRGRSS
jgi:DNA-binding response OmpR family regulator